MAKANLDFISKLQELLGDKPDPNEPRFIAPRIQVAYSFLSDKPISNYEIHHLYGTIETMSHTPVGATVIRHGHEKGEICWANCYCHEFTYRPKPEDPISFRTLFQQKWRYE